MENNSRVAEVDTDGILVTSNPDVAAINEFIRDSVKAKFGIDNCTLEMEKERFERGFIHKMKNYILIEKNKNTGELSPIVHGAYFVSSRAPQIYDDAVKLVVKYVMDDTIKEEDIRQEALAIHNRPIEDFVLRVRMSKNVKDYLSSSKDIILDINREEHIFNTITTEVVYADTFAMNGAQIVGLAYQMKLITGMVPEKGTIISYIIAKDPVTGRKTYEYFNPRDETIMSRLNYIEYENMISTMFDSTNIAPFSKTRKEDNWMEELFEL